MKTQKKIKSSGSKTPPIWAGGKFSGKDAKPKKVVKKVK